MNNVVTYFEIAAFIASTFAWRHLRRSKYLRLFPILLLLVVIVEVHQTFFQEPGTNNAAIYNFQVPLQHLLYLGILYLSVDEGRYKRLLLVAIVFFVVWALTTGVFFTETNHFNILAYCAGSILIIVGILVKFYEMLHNPADFNFLRDPFFYLLFAYLLFNVGTLPYFTMSNWLHFLKTPENVKQILINVMSIFNYILYTTYTLVFLWMTARAESSLSQRR